MRLEIVLIVLLVLDIGADYWLFREQRRQHREYLAEMRRKFGPPPDGKR